MGPYTTLYQLFLNAIFGTPPEDASGVKGGVVTKVAGGDDVSEPEPPGPGHKQRYLWFIDAGHDEAQAGKRSPELPYPVKIYGRTFYTLREYIVNRDIAERLIEMLDASGIAYMRTLPEGTKIGNGLSQRIANVNSYKTDLPKRGVSIHSNALSTNHPSGWQSVLKGIETWHYSKSRTGADLAIVFQSHLMRTANEYAKKNGLERRKDRGVKFKTSGEFRILRETTPPFALTENLAFNNWEEAGWLQDEAYRQASANAHFDAIVEIEARPQVQSLVSSGPDDLRSILTFISMLLTVFQRDPKERAQNRRNRYIRNLQKREAKGKITREQYDRYLSDYDKDNLNATSK